MTLAAARAGDQIGRYTLGPALGAGGAGAVFETWGAAGEPLAIKVVASAGDPAMQARARREVDALSRISHRCVLGVIDWGVDGDHAFLVTPRIGGITLRQLLAGGALLPETAALLIGLAAAGAGAIHAAGLVHRDLKPDNIMITDDGRVVVIDLGLALAPDWTRQTVEGTIAGSLPYMAPEQIEGTASPASDVWALGVTLWELIVGQRPFGRSRAPEEVAAILGGVRPRFAEADRRASAELAALVERCLGPAAQRPADGAALARALDALVLPGLGTADLDATIRAIRADRAGWEVTQRPALARRAALDARALAAAGDPFAAMRAIDRGMAHAPDEPALAEALAAVLPAVQASGSHAVAVAHATPVATGQPRRRRWPWIASGGGVLASVGVAAALLAGSSSTGPAPYQLDQRSPDKVVEAVIRAARTGDGRDLPTLCYPGLGDRDVRDICAATPGTPEWAGFVAAFSGAVIKGFRVVGDGAVVGVGLGRGGSHDEEIRLYRRGDLYYLGSF